MVDMLVTGIDDVIARSIDRFLLRLPVTGEGPARLIKLEGNGNRRGGLGRRNIGLGVFRRRGFLLAASGKRCATDKQQ